jgi:hypothetical protein
MVAVERKASFPVSVTEHGVMSPAGVFGFDTPKSAEEHVHSFCDLGGAKLTRAQTDKLALVCGVASGLVVIQVGPGQGSFVPDLNPGRYGVEHTLLGSAISTTKRIVDVKAGTTHAIFGIVPDQWLDGLNSCTLVQPDLEGSGSITLLADNAVHPIEPTPGFRFYTPFHHIPAAGSGALTRAKNTVDMIPRRDATVYPLYQIGVMTLDRMQLSELLRAFNEDWSNGPIFACKNPVIAPPNGGRLEK